MELTVIIVILQLEKVNILGPNNYTVNGLKSNGKLYDPASNWSRRSKDRSSHELSDTELPL